MGSFTKEVDWTPADLPARLDFFRACQRGDAKLARKLLAKRPKLALDRNDDLAEFWRAGDSGLAVAAMAGRFALAEELDPLSGEWWRSTNKDSRTLAFDMAHQDQAEGLRWLHELGERTGRPELAESFGAFDGEPKERHYALLGLGDAFGDDPAILELFLRRWPRRLLAEGLRDSIAALEAIPADEPVRVARVLGCARAFAALGADPNAPARSGLALTAAALLERNWAPAMDLLIELGADPRAKGPSGRSCLEEVAAAGAEHAQRLAPLLAEIERRELDERTPGAERPRSGPARSL